MKNLLQAVFLSISFSLAMAPQAGAAIQDPVRIAQGQLSRAAAKSPGMKVYRGIPHAAPPVGDLRWKAPQPAAAWKGVRQATEFGSGCMQTPPAWLPQKAILLYKSLVSPSQSEDCLYLNVWTPANSAGDKLPVMFWIHGGGFTFGSASIDGYDGENLARKGVVVVTSNYRLGIFGFFALPELTAESPHHASGNYGLMDMIAALQWVRKNIAAFGGNPRNVTIFGESSGAGAVNLLTASPPAKGLFQRAIAESGAEFVEMNSPPMTTRRDAEHEGVKLASGMGATQDVLKTLRAKPAIEILKATASSDSLGSAIVDGWVLPQDVDTVYAQGKQNDVPTIVGSNANEGTALMPPVKSAARFVARVKQRYGDVAGEFLKIYPAGSDAQAVESAYASFSDEVGWEMRHWARLQTKTGHRPAYRYYFSHRPPGPQGEQLGAFHALELAYVFGNFMIYPFPWDDTDRKLSETIISYWTNLAKTGDPNGEGLPKWPAYNPADDNVLDFADPVTVRAHVNQAGLDFIDTYGASHPAAPSAGTGPK